MRLFEGRGAVGKLFRGRQIVLSSEESVASEGGFSRNGIFPGFVRGVGPIEGPGDQIGG